MLVWLVLGDLFDRLNKLSSNNLLLYRFFFSSFLLQPINLCKILMVLIFQNNVCQLRGDVSYSCEMIYTHLVVLFICVGYCMVSEYGKSDLSKKMLIIYPNRLLMFFLARLMLLQ